MAAITTIDMWKM